MKRLLFPLVAVAALWMPSSTFAADDDKPANDKPAVERPATPPPATPPTGSARGRLGGPGGLRALGGGGGPGGPGALLGVRDPLDELIAILGELNLDPDFTLTTDQKEKIHAVRDEFKKLMDKWNAEHETDIKKLQDQMTQLRTANAGNQGGAGGQGGGQANRAKFQEVAQARQELQATAPKSDEAIVQIKGILTTEQLKRFEVKQSEHQAENQRLRQALGNRLGSGAGGPGGLGGGGNRGGANAAGGAANGAPRGNRGNRGGGRGGAGGVPNGL